MKTLLLTKTLLSARLLGVALGLTGLPAQAQGQPSLPSPAAAPATAAPAGFVLRGRVVDADTRQPVPNAQVGVGDNRVGTSTNDAGRFVLAVPAAYARTALTVALLGYERYRRPLAELTPDATGAAELTVALRRSPAALGEVAVQGSVTGIIREALARIPRNYATRPTQLTGFLRETDATPAGRPLFVAEATEQVLVPPYTAPYDAGQVRLAHSRKVDLRQGEKGGAELNWGAGAFVPLRFDFVRTRAEFIQPGRFARYTYRVAELTSFNGEQVYVIAFGPRPGQRGAHYAGKLFIGAESYAFLGADVRELAGGRNLPGAAADSAAARTLHSGAAAPGGSFIQRSWTTTYQPFGGRWSLKEVHYRASVDTRPPLRHAADFLATALDTAGVRAFDYVERAQFGDVFLKNGVAYDSAFWRGYVPPLASTALQQALAAQAGPAAPRGAAPDSLAAGGPAGGAGPSVFERAQAAARPPSPWRRRRAAFWERLSVSYALGTVGVQAQAATTSLRFAPGGGFVADGQTATAAGQRFPLLTAFGYQFDLLPRRLYLRYTSLDVAGQYGADLGSQQLGLGLDLNLRPRHRPVLLRLGLDYLSLVLGREVGPFDNPDRGLRLDGTPLKAAHLAAAVQARTRAWPPRLGLGLELDHQTQLFLDASYLLAPQTTARLSLRETSGFFLSRNEASAPLGQTEGAAVLVNDAPAAALPWQPQRLLLQVGLVRRLR